MLDQDCVIDTLAVAPLASPVLFKEMEFTPALLLKASFDASITASAQYQEGCEYGFFDYFEEMYQMGASGLRDVFVDRFYTWADVEREVVEEVAVAAEEHDTPLWWVVGFEHAWLSALALTDRALALRGLGLLTRLVAVMTSH